MDTLETRSCSKCGGQLDTTGTPLWCRKCRAAYKREYEETRQLQTSARSFAAGVAATKEYFARRFYSYGAGCFAGDEIAKLILNAVGPQPPES